MARPDLIPSRGAVAEPLLLEVERALTAQDLARLADAPKVSVPILQKLRATHHRQAQLLASGKKVKEVAAIVGCTEQRLVQLQVDPTFRDLIAYYQDQQMAAMLSDSARIADKLVDAAELAVDELHRRLEDEGLRNAMRTDDVRKIAEFGLDRTVAPPKVAATAPVSPTNITISFGTPVKREAPTIEVLPAPASVLSPIPAPASSIDTKAKARAEAEAKVAPAPLSAEAAMRLLLDEE